MKSKKSDDISIEETEKKIIEYRSNLSQVESILDREKLSNSTKLTDLIKLQKDLKSAIEFYEDIRKFKLQTSTEIFNNIPLTAENNGRICTAYFDQEKNWFMAMINSVDEKEQTAEVTWLGYKEKQTIPFHLIKIQEALKPQDLEIGMQCEAIYYEDGKWYESTIENISEHGIHVKYNKYEDTEVVSLDSIRITPEQKLANQKKKETQAKSKQTEDDLEFKLPEYLKITPADNEQQRLSKKKRAKSIKNKHTQKIIEIVSKEKQDNWLSFAQKAPKMKTSTIKKKENN